MRPVCKSRLPIIGAALLTTSLGMTGSVVAQSSRFEARGLPDAARRLKLQTPLQIGNVKLDRSLASAEGRQQIIVRLKTPSVADVHRIPETELNDDRDRARASRRAAIDDEQAGFLERCLRLAPEARVIAQTRLVLNAVFLELDASSLAAIAEDPAVTRIAPVGDYNVFLSETVPHIGAAAVHDAGFDGSGVRVAILDSGIDYYHANFGGSGDPDDFANDDPTIIEPGTFPTTKVVGGYDFVGSDWPTYGSLAPDPDPLDDDLHGTGQNAHGTHVADIAGGQSGVAPGAALYAVKVCSSVSTACSGVALIQGMEFAVDPNGDLDPSDHVDVINMSLGAHYGQPFDDDLSAAVDNATALGVLTVAAAGNGADKPYVHGTPASARTALSVAQTHVPSAFQPFMTVLPPSSDAGDYLAVRQTWSAEPVAPIQSVVTYGDGAGGNLDGCAPFTVPLSGIVAVDRGTCYFSDKIRNIEDAGGSLGVIMLVAPGEPFDGGFGGGPAIGIPGYMISQAAGDILRSGSGVVEVLFGPTNGVSLSMSMVSSSSRGPQMDDNRIKPEIAAPGASVSAEAGTGAGQAAFGGTSGAAPMVAGSAALLIQAFPHRSPLEIKAVLMNTGETDILNGLSGDLAAISRIGGGEVRVDRALQSAAAAWDDSDRRGHCRHPGHFHRTGVSGGLSFGFHDVAKRKLRLTRIVRVKNYSSHNVAYQITPTFRFTDDETTGAVRITAPKWIWVWRHKSAAFKVTLEIDGTRLSGNYMSSGSEGDNPTALTINEFDGYLTLAPLPGVSTPIHLPWHVLPRQAAMVRARPWHVMPGGNTVELANLGVGTAQNDSYSLLALSENIPEGGRGEEMPTPDIRAVGVNTYPVPAGFCSDQDSFVWAFAVNTWERQTHVIPMSHQVSLDTNQDDTADFVVLNRDASFDNVTDGRNVTWAFDLATGDATAFFFTEHATNTNNTVLLVCAEQIGLTGADMLATNVNATFYAQDFYYGGPGDNVPPVGDPPLTITPLGERFVGSPVDLPGRTMGEMPVSDFGDFPGNTPELGLMLFTNGDRGAGARGGATEKTETLLLTKPDVKFPEKKRKHRFFR